MASTLPQLKGLMPTQGGQSTSLLPTDDQMQNYMKGLMPRVPYTYTYNPSAYRGSSKSNSTYTSLNLADTKNKNEMNSWADIITKNINAALTWDSDGNVRSWGSGLRHLGNTAKDLGEWFKNYVWQPLTVDPDNEAISGWNRKGIVAMNLATNFGETADLLANPVKGAFLSKNGFMQGISDAWGNTKNGEFSRETFNWDVETGNKYTNFAANLFLEVISDPMNLITFGGNLALKKGLKGATEMLGETVEEAMKQPGVYNAYKKGMSKAAKIWMEDGATKEFNDVMLATVNNLAQNTKNKGGVIFKFTAKDADDLMKLYTSGAMRTNASQVLEGLAKVVKVADTTNNTIAKMAWTGAGIYPAFAGIKTAMVKGSSFLNQAAAARFVVAQQDLLSSHGNVSPFNFDKFMSRAHDEESIFKTASRIMRDPSVSLEQGTARKVAIKSIKQDYNKVIRIFLMHMDEPDKIVQFLQEMYPGIAKDSDDIINEYMKALVKVNNKVGNELATEVSLINQLVRGTRDAIRNGIIKKSVKLADEVVESIDEFIEAYGSLSTGRTNTLTRTGFEAVDSGQEVTGDALKLLREQKKAFQEVQLNVKKANETLETALVQYQQATEAVRELRVKMKGKKVTEIGDLGFELKKAKRFHKKAKREFEAAKQAVARAEGIRARTPKPVTISYETSLNSRLLVATQQIREMINSGNIDPEAMMKLMREAFDLETNGLQRLASLISGVYKLSREVPPEFIKLVGLNYLDDAFEADAQTLNRMLGSSIKDYLKSVETEIVRYSEVMPKYQALVDRINYRPSVQEYMDGTDLPILDRKLIYNLNLLDDRRLDTAYRLMTDPNVHPDEFTHMIEGLSNELMYLDGDHVSFMDMPGYRPATQFDLPKYDYKDTMGMYKMYNEMLDTMQEVQARISMMSDKALNGIVEVNNVHYTSIEEYLKPNLTTKKLVDTIKNTIAAAEKDIIGDYKTTPVKVSKVTKIRENIFEMMPPLIKNTFAKQDTTIESIMEGFWKELLSDKAAFPDMNPKGIAGKFATFFNYIDGVTDDTGEAVINSPDFADAWYACVAELRKVVDNATVKASAAQVVSSGAGIQEELAEAVAKLAEAQRHLDEVLANGYARIRDKTSGILKDSPIVDGIRRYKSGKLVEATVDPADVKVYQDAVDKWTEAVNRKAKLLDDFNAAAKINQTTVVKGSPIEKVAEILRQFESLGDVYKSLDADVLIKETGAYYVFKEEATMTNFKLLTLDRLNKLVLELDTNSNIGEFINSFVEVLEDATARVTPKTGSIANADGALKAFTSSSAGDVVVPTGGSVARNIVEVELLEDTIANDPFYDMLVAAKQLKEQVSVYNSYRHFIDMLIHRPMDENLKSTFISVLQKARDKNPIEFLENFDYYFDTILDQTEIFMNSKDGTLPKLALDHLMKNEEVQKLMAPIKAMLEKDYGYEISNHDAVFDTFGLREVLREKGILQKLEDLTGKKILLFDIETSDLNMRRGQVQQISIVESSSNKYYDFKANIDPTKVTQQVSISLLSKFGFKDMAEMVAKRSGEFTEKEILQRFLRTIMDYGADNVVLIGHNSSKFDVDAIIKRMKAAGLTKAEIGMFENYVEKMDALSYMRKEMYNFKSAYPPAAKRLKDMLRDYAQEQVSLGSNKLIAPGQAKMAELINRISGGLREMANPKYGMQDSAISGTMKNLSTTVINDMAIQMKLVSSEIYEALGSIAKNNRQLGRIMFSDEIHTNKGVLAKLVAKFPQLEGLNIHNISHLLYGVDDAAVKPYGYKKVIDFDLLHSWFKLNPGEKMSAKVLQKMQMFARRMDTIRNSIKNVELIQQNQDAIDYMFNRLVATDQTPEQFLNEGYKAYANQFGPIFLKLQNEMPDTYSKYAVAEYLYNWGKSKGIFDEYFYNGIPEDVIKLFDDTVEFHKAMKRGAIYRSIDDAVVNDLDMVATSFQNATIDNLEQLGNQFSDTNLLRTEALTKAQTLKPVKVLVDIYNNIVKTLSGEEIKDLFTNVDYATRKARFQQVHNLIQMTPEQLLSHMVYRAPMIRISSMLTADDYTNIVKDFTAKAASYKEVGINVFTTEQGNVYLTLDKSLEISRFNESIIDKFGRRTTQSVASVNGVTLNRFDLDDLDFDAINAELPEELAAQLKLVRQNYSRLTEQSINGTLGDFITVKDVERIYKEIIPEEIVKTMHGLDVLFNDDIAGRGMFNHMIIGDLTAVKEILPRSGTVLNNAMYTAENISKSAVTRIQFTDMFFHSDFAINNSRLFLDSNPEDLIEALKNAPEFSVATLVQDRRYGFRVERLKINSVKDLNRAMELNAIMLPTSTLFKFADVLNTDIINQNRYAKILSRLMYLYKAGYLFGSGPVLRNEGDSTLKTILSADSNILEVGKGQWEANKLLNQYNKAVHDIMLLNQFDLVQIEKAGLRGQVEEALRHTMVQDRITAQTMMERFEAITQDIIRMDRQKIIRADNVDFYFSRMNPDMPKEAFVFMHQFINDSAAGGEVAALRMMTQNSLKFNNIGDEIWNKVSNTVNFFMRPMEKVEQINRLSMYLTMARNGSSDAKAFYEIIKTHFDYGDKATWQKMVEFVFPFYTFSQKNLEYYMDMILSSPSKLNPMADMFTAYWEASDYTTEDLRDEHGRMDWEADRSKNLRYNMSLRKNIMNGSLPLFDSGLTLKLSPSLLDAVQVVTDFGDTVQSKLFTPIGNLFDMAKAGMSGTENFINVVQGGEGTWQYQKLWDAVPIVGALTNRYFVQGQEYFDRTGNPINAILPDVFGATKPMPENNYTNYVKKATSTNYKGYAQAQQQYQQYANKPKTPRTVRIPKARKVFTERSYANRAYNKWYYNNSGGRYDKGIYEKIYRKSGTSRGDSLRLKLSGHTLKYRIQDMRMRMG